MFSLCRYINNKEHIIKVSVYSTPELIEKFIKKLGKTINNNDNNAIENEQIIEDNETFFESNNITANMMIPTIVNDHDVAMITPANEDTALPPLKLYQTGKQ